MTNIEILEEIQTLHKVLKECILTDSQSAHKVNFAAPEKLAKRLGVQTSTVTTENGSCPSSKQGNKCLDCRACWNRSVANVSYLKH
jgi:hypothetical protein